LQEVANQIRLRRFHLTDQRDTQLMHISSFDLGECLLANNLETK
jgi:hypothetical protein